MFSDTIVRLLSTNPAHTRTSSAAAPLGKYKVVRVRDGGAVLVG